jgi:hypothetical protein
MVFHYHYLRELYALEGREEKLVLANLFSVRFGVSRTMLVGFSAECDVSLDTYRCDGLSPTQLASLIKTNQSPS